MQTRQARHMQWHHLRVVQHCFLNAFFLLVSVRCAMESKEPSIALSTVCGRLLAFQPRLLRTDFCKSKYQRGRYMGSKVFHLRVRDGNRSVSKLLFLAIQDDRVYFVSLAYFLTDNRKSTFRPSRWGRNICNGKSFSVVLRRPMRSGI